MPIAPLGAPAPAAGAAAQPQGGFGAALRARAATLAAPAARAAPSPALAALREIERAQARLDQVLQAARAGRTFTAAELLGLQAEAYRFGQTVDLGARLVEQGAQAVKQALNTQL
jgi:ribosomal protein L13E